MPKLRITMEYEVDVPEHGTPEYEAIITEMVEDENDQNGVYACEWEKLRSGEGNGLIAHYLLEKSHVGDHTERVELKYDTIMDA